MANDFQPAPGDLALMQRFLNSVEFPGRPDRLRDAASTGRWLQQNGLAADDTAIEEEDRLRLVALRDALRSMLRGSNRGAADAGAFGRINAIAAETPFVIELREGQAVLRPLGSGIARVVAQLMATIHAGMRDGAWQRLKLCASEECPMAFYDTSKNRSGAWCSMAQCGNRAKVRAYQTRKRSTEYRVPSTE